MKHRGWWAAIATTLAACSGTVSHSPGENHDAAGAAMAGAAGSFEAVGASGKGASEGGQAAVVPGHGGAGGAAGQAELTGQGGVAGEGGAIAQAGTAGEGGEGGALETCSEFAGGEIVQPAYGELQGFWTFIPPDAPKTHWSLDIFLGQYGELVQFDDSDPSKPVVLNIWKGAIDLYATWLVIITPAGPTDPSRVLHIRYQHVPGSTTLYLSWPDCAGSAFVPFKLQ